MAILGISYPFRRGTTSYPVGATDDDVIRDNILRSIQTPRGSRVMRSSAGSDAWSFVFENTGALLSARIDEEVRRAVAEGEPRANVLMVNVGREERSDGGINVVVEVIYSVNRDVGSVTASFPTGGA